MFRDLLVVLILGLLLIQIVNSYPNFPHPDVVSDNFDGEADEAAPERSVRSAEEYTIDDYKENCGITHSVPERKSIKFTTPFYGTGQSYPADITCKYIFIGDAKCTPELSCKKFELKPAEDGECDDEYLEVADGIGGGEKICGHNSFAMPLRSSNGGRDLFVTVQTGDGGKKYGGISCQVKCSPNLKATRELKAVEDARKEEFGCVCGLRNQDDRIVGGQDVSTMAEFPWQAALVKPGTRQPMCGASVINDRYILTASHCFVLAGIGAKDVEVLIHAQVLDANTMPGAKDVALGKLGSLRASGYKEKKRTDKDEKTQRYKVVEVVNHALFTDKYDYDVTVLKLDKKIDLKSPDAPTPICLPAIGDYSTTYEGKVPWVVGWGLADESAGGTTRMLQKLDVPVLSQKRCQKWMPYELTDRMICAGYEEGVKDACTGDSGGPLVYQKPNKQWEQIGIVSWGEGCARKHRPGMYSRVTDLNQWIRYHAKDATWCRDSKAIQD